MHTAQGSAGFSRTAHSRVSSTADEPGSATAGASELSSPAASLRSLPSDRSRPEAYDVAKRNVAAGCWPGAKLANALDSAPCYGPLLS